jgi:xylulose-5-phosphate/fructose-6-phosphate phosphoketolase
VTPPVASAWDAANYLSVAQLYLRRNVLLEEPLTPEDVKPRIVGHWGAAPGVNFILAHLSLVARTEQVPILPVIGTGHAASSMLAWLYLEGSLGETYPRLAWSRAGVETLVSSFGTGGPFRTELSAFLPGTLSANGEIGPAYAIAQGIALDLTSPVVACVVGDGELETGPAAASLLATRELRGHAGHYPVVIVNLNGCRMGSRSILGGMNSADVEGYFRSLGYRVAQLDLPDHNAAHAAFGEALRHPVRPHAIVVRSAKGVTFPEADGRFAGVVGTPRAHKAPLIDPRRDREEFELLSRWLESYRPRELFEDGVPSKAVRAALPPPPLRLGRQWRALPAPEPLALEGAPESPHGQPMQRVEAFLAGVLQAEANRSRLRIFSPDELGSNRLVGLLERCPGRLLEVLSEDVCQAWAEGYVRSGRHALVVSYEAFASRFASSFAQYVKFSRESGEAGFRPTCASLNYLLTSLGWHNVYSHQNPDFVSIVLLRESDSVRVHLPVNGRRLVARLREALASSGCVNALVASKHEIGPELDDAAERDLTLLGAAAPGEPVHAPDVILAAAGDVVCASVQEAARILAGRRPALRVRTVFVEELRCLSLRSARSLAPAAYSALFGDGQPVLFVFNGYAATIEALLAGRPNARWTTVIGYGDVAGHDFESNLTANGMAPAQLAARVLSSVPREETPCPAPS